MSEIAMWLIGQGIVIVGAIFVAYNRLSVKVAVVESNTSGLKSDHNSLSKKVDGISRHVSNMEGQLKQLSNG